MLPFIPFNQGGHDPNLQQAMLFNPNLANPNTTQMANLNGNNNNNLSNFHGLNPYLQPVNNQLGGVLPQQLMALQLQGQINLLSQLQSQGLLFGQNPMLGLQNQMMQGNPMMGFVGNNNNSNNNINNNNYSPQMVRNDANASFGNANRQQVYHAKVDSKNSSVSSQNFANGSSTHKFPGFGKGESSHNRFQKFQSHDARNQKGNKRQFNKNGRRGEHNQRGGKLPSANSGEEAPTLRPRFTINYSENEIQQWREARKKNFPSRASINKKLATCGKSNEDAGDDRKLRRQQLKEVLAKQAELGVEVAEIPPSYFREPEQFNEKEMQQWREARKKNFPTRANIDKKEASATQAELDVADSGIQIAPRYLREPEEQVHEMKDNVDDREVNKRKEMDRNGTSQNMSNNKRRRRGQKFKNRAYMGSPSIVKREPSLLQKLLSSDIKRDKSRLLQVFRFMALNDFFKHWPDKTLEFPVITVKGVGCANEVSGEENPSLNGADSAAVGVLKNEIVGAIDAQKESGEADEVQKRFAKDNNDITIDDEEFNNPMETEDGCIEQDETSEEGEIVN